MEKQVDTGRETVVSESRRIKLGQLMKRVKGQLATPYGLQFLLQMSPHGPRKALSHAGDTHVRMG